MGRKGRDKRDVYLRRAKEQGWRSRSAFKLLQLAHRFGVLDQVHTAVDLCAAPGGWTQVIRKHIPEHKGTTPEPVVAVDLWPMKPLAGCRVLRGDITHHETHAAILQHFGKQSKTKIDLVVCDGAPDVIRREDFDEYVQHTLLHAAVRLATHLLRMGGTFVCKVFRGQRVDSDVRLPLRRLFASVVVSKPPASRHASPEVFIVCRGFRGGTLLSLPDMVSTATQGQYGYVSGTRHPVAQRVLQGVAPSSPMTTAEVPYMACDATHEEDADRSYPLTYRFHESGSQNQAYQYREASAAPIAPPYQQALAVKRQLANHKAPEAHAEQKE